MECTPNIKMIMESTWELRSPKLAKYLKHIRGQRCKNHSNTKVIFLPTTSLHSHRLYMQCIIGWCVGILVSSQGYCAAYSNSSKEWRTGQRTYTKWLLRCLSRWHIHDTTHMVLYWQKSQCVRVSGFVLFALISSRALRAQRFQWDFGNGGNPFRHTFNKIPKMPLPLLCVSCVLPLTHSVFQSHSC